MKKSFVLHLDSLDILQELTTEQKGELLQAMFDFQLGNETSLSGLMKAVFVPFKNQFDRDNLKYIATCEKNAANGSNGGRPRKPTVNQNNPMGLLETKHNPQKADSDSDSKSDNGNDNRKDLILFPLETKKEKSPDDLMFEKFNTWLKANAPTVLKMKEPLKLDQLLKLQKDFTRDQILGMFIKMHNYELLLKKSKSAYLTFLNWMDRESKGK